MELLHFPSFSDTHHTANEERSHDFPVTAEISFISILTVSKKVYVLLFQGKVYAHFSFSPVSPEAVGDHADLNLLFPDSGIGVVKAADKRTSGLRRNLSHTRHI